MALADAWNAWDDKPAKNNTRAACPEITSIAGSRKFMALPEGWVWLAGVGQSAVYAVSGGGRQRCHCEHGCRACRAQADIKISGVNAETRLASRQLGLFFSNVFGRLAGELIRI
ncbi:unnamed protein product [Effrenium voratum]|nr:unnamed protein product [Effrenium voratum]